MLQNARVTGFAVKTNIGGEGEVKLLVPRSPFHTKIRVNSCFNSLCNFFSWQIPFSFLTHFRPIFHFFIIFKIFSVKRGQFHIFQKSRGSFIPNITRNKHVITGESHQTKKHFLLKLISFNSGLLRISERAKYYQNNTVNGAMPVSINRVING